MFALKIFFEFSGMVAVQLSMFFVVVFATAYSVYHRQTFLSTTFFFFFSEVSLSLRQLV